MRNVNVKYPNQAWYRNQPHHYDSVSCVETGEFHHSQASKPWLSLRSISTCTVSSVYICMCVHYSINKEVLSDLRWDKVSVSERDRFLGSGLKVLNRLRVYISCSFTRQSISNLQWSNIILASNLSWFWAKYSDKKECSKLNITSNMPTFLRKSSILSEYD